MHRHLKKASERKKHGGKTYYILGDDKNSLEILASLRGYKPTKKVVWKNGKKTFKTVSAVQNLLNDN